MLHFSIMPRRNILRLYVLCTTGVKCCDQYMRTSERVLVFVDEAAFCIKHWFSASQAKSSSASAFTCLVVSVYARLAIQSTQFCQVCDHGSAPEVVRWLWSSIITALSAKAH